jgi:CRISPR-associated protein Cas1
VLIAPLGRWTTPGAERIIDLSEEPAWLNVDTSRLVISRDEQPKVSIPLAEVAVLVVAHPQVVMTQAVLAGVAEQGGIAVICDGKRMPAAMLMPLAGHFAQGERFALQAKASLPTCKRLWQSLVKAKIRAQARALADLLGDDAGLPQLADKVRSGDPSNVEAEASRRYWPALFADPRFRRDRDGGGPNALLNYGYAVLRAIVARAVCAAGLHPSLGLQHHNRYDAFRLADDLMEPFRPIVDRAVVTHCARRGLAASLDKEAKAALIGSLMGRFSLGKESRSLFDIAGRTAVSLTAVFSGRRRTLVLPEL